MEIGRKKYLDKLIKRKHNGLVKIITGFRRCGKSYLLNKLFIAICSTMALAKIASSGLLLIPPMTWLSSAKS